MPKLGEPTVHVILPYICESSILRETSAAKFVALGGRIISKVLPKTRSGTGRRSTIPIA